jgi:hypothetical protein
MPTFSFLSRSKTQTMSIAFARTHPLLTRFVTKIDAIRISDHSGTTILRLEMQSVLTQHTTAATVTWALQQFALAVEEERLEINLAVSFFAEFGTTIQLGTVSVLEQTAMVISFGLMLDVMFANVDVSCPRFWVLLRRFAIDQLRILQEQNVQSTPLRTFSPGLLDVDYWNSLFSLTRSL